MIIFLVTFLIWLALTAGGGWQEIVAGLVVALAASLIAGRFRRLAAPKADFKHWPRRIVFSLLFFFKFVWEMIKANVNVAAIVLHPKRPIKPGIIKIRTGLKTDAALTTLANAITLTPGTFTVDINPAEQELYIHCLTVKSADTEHNTRDIGLKFERLIKEVFE
jgi:multicomponent Na+:H+ antiporter subunit E